MGAASIHTLTVPTSSTSEMMRSVLRIMGHPPLNVLDQRKNPEANSKKPTAHSPMKIPTPSFALCSVRLKFARAYHEKSPPAIAHLHTASPQTLQPSF